MLELGAVAFAAPLVLTALALLPVIWWLVRISPPAPRRVRFPAVRLLLGLEPPEETPARIPWWLLLLRLLIAALVILALAHPLLEPDRRLDGSGPVLLVVDDGWASARDWQQRRAVMDDVLDEASRQGREVALVTTAPVAAPLPPLQLTRPSVAREAVGALAPRPWPVDRVAALERIEALSLDRPAEIVWLADGVGDDGTRRFAERLQRVGAVTAIRAGEGPHLLMLPMRGASSLDVGVRRPAATGEESVTVRGLAEDGRTLVDAVAVFEPDALEAEARLAAPGELLNDITRVRIQGMEGAGTTVLLDESWRRRPVGIVSAGAGLAGHPLLDDRHFIESGLDPFTDLYDGSVDELLERRMAVIVLSDAAEVTSDEFARLAGWVDQGGVLLRFGGARLAESPDDLLPVAIRRGGRALGGAMSWSNPQRLAPFPDGSPFQGLDIPEEVEVQRQVLAEPAVDLEQRTWAALEDGTPLVTAARDGEGWIVLLHTSANAEWSNLSLSGLFVEMLQRLVALSRGVREAPEGRQSLAPVELLDGFGRLGASLDDARTLSPERFGEVVPGPRHPPGYWGREADRRALNLSPRVPELRPLGPLPGGVAEAGLTPGAERDLKPWLLLAALALALADAIVTLAMRGHLARLGRALRRRSGAAPAASAAVLLATAGVFALAPSSAAGGDDDFALRASLETTLAYVVTGDPAVDETSHAGLAGLGRTLTERTSVEPADPMGVDPETDEIAFFPLLYWPVTEAQPALSEAGRRRIGDFLQNGGSILFDTRDQGLSGGSASVPGGATPERQHLRRLLSGIQVPPLTPVPPDHVLTKAFYLINDFPGRWAGGSLWVEETGARRNDGVSAVMIGGNDWAGAWAMDGSGRPLNPVVPGGEQQREIALRFGVNLVMYVLTGNYKADQVHVPSILERLGE